MRRTPTFEQPTIHNVMRLKARATVVRPSESHGFACLSLTFCNQYGDGAELDVYFPRSATAYVCGLADSINAYNEAFDDSEEPPRDLPDADPIAESRMDAADEGHA